MGKKSRKTRWRTLSIGEGQSDTESTGGDGAKSQVSRGRWGAPNTNGAYPKFNSSHSTPTHQNKQNSYNLRHRTEFRGNGTFGGSHIKQGSTRSSSTTSETKITFNEDEYTKITTPRQDVLFKKGYLSKPKPYMQRPLTSAGNSTGDGTPDHQSADGADYPENDLDGFPYPSYGGEVFNPNLYYLNYDVAASGHPVVLYDQFGNSALFYPPPLNIPPHSQQSYHPENAENPKKRYSVDSICESASPNNETIENEAEIVEPEVFEGAKVFPGSEIQEVEAKNPEDVEENDKILEKKPKRRKSLNEENTHLVPDNSDSIKSEENQNEQREEVPDAVSTEKKLEVDESENIAEEQEVDQNELTSFRVDAEEFIPRNFVPAYNFVPFMPPDMYPGHFVILPPPAFYPPVTALQPVQPLTNEEPPQIEEENAEETIKKEETNEIKEKQGIDIAKIVSKLEEAAREQKIREETEENETKEETNHSKSEETQTDNESLIQTHESIEEKIEEKKVKEKCVEETKECVESKKQLPEIKEPQQVEKKTSYVEKLQNKIKLEQINPQEHIKLQKQISVGETAEKVQKNVENSVNKSPRQNSVNKIENNLKLNNSLDSNSSKSPPVHPGVGQNNLKLSHNGTKVNENKFNKKTENIRYSDRLKNNSASNRGPKNGPTVNYETSNLTKTPKYRSNAANVQNILPNNSQSMQKKCPRFERTQKAANGTSEKNIHNICSQNTSGGNSSDQWISVSGKKKRKNMKNNFESTLESELPIQNSDSSIPESTVEHSDCSFENSDITALNSNLITQNFESDISVQKTELLTEPAKEDVLMNHNSQISEPEEISNPQTAIIEKTKKDKKEKNGPKKLTKKRVIINDAALPDSGVLVKDVPPLLPPVEPVLPDVIKKDKIEEILEDLKEPTSLPKTPASLTTIKTTPDSKKTKTKKRKNKIANSLESSISDSNTSNGDLTDILLTNLESLEVTQETTDYDNVTLELEKMIQKGLYANLEQKLEKNDSFLASFGGSAPLGGFVGPPKLVNSSLLPFPKIVLPKKTSPTEINPVPKIEQTEVPIKTSTPNGLSITKAVREWMDRTRENTPEVEIFRKPEELRQEVLCKVMDYENDFSGHLSGVEEENFPIYEDDFSDDQEIDTSAKDASIVADELRSRSPSVDLLQCWEYDVMPPVVHQEIEPCEEAVEHYESVYGSARDFDRIRNEVLRESSGNLGTFLPRRGDGGLPYRAICCSVM